MKVEKTQGSSLTSRHWLLGAAALKVAEEKNIETQCRNVCRLSLWCWKTGNYIIIGNFLILFWPMMPIKASFHPNTC